MRERESEREGEGGIKIEKENERLANLFAVSI